MPLHTHTHTYIYKYKSNMDKHSHIQKREDKTDYNQNRTIETNHTSII